MKIIEDGNLSKPSLLFLPSEFITYSNYSKLINNLKNDFRIYFISYDGHDETERDLSFDYLKDIEEIETYFKKKEIDHIDLVYTSSLGGLLFLQLLESTNLKFNKIIFDEISIPKKHKNLSKKIKIRSKAKKFIKSREDLDKYKSLLEIDSKTILDKENEESLNKLFKSINIFSETTIKSIYTYLYNFNLNEIKIEGDDLDIVYWNNSKNNNKNNLKFLKQYIPQIRIVNTNTKISRNLFFFNHEELSKRIQLFFEIR